MNPSEVRFEDIVDAAISKNKKILKLEVDVSVLKSDGATIKSDLAALKRDVHHQGLLHEAMQRDIKLILDVVVPLREQSEKFNGLVDTMVRFDHRLSAVEAYVKQQLEKSAPV